MTRIDGNMDFEGEKGGDIVYQGEYNASASGAINILNFGPYDIHMLSSGNIEFFTGNGKRIQLNGSGVATMVDFVSSPSFFWGYLAFNQGIPPNTNTLMKWNKYVQRGFTHTDGDVNIVFNDTGTYKIDVYLESDYNVAGHLHMILLNGVSNNLKVTYPTTLRRSDAYLTGILENIDAGTNLQVVASVDSQPVDAPEGFNWLSPSSRISIFKIA